jgi:hypothetical protein
MLLLPITARRSTADCGHIVFLIYTAHRTPHVGIVARGAEEKKKKTTYLPTCLFENICMVFLSSSCRETAKNAIKK